MSRAEDLLNDLYQDAGKVLTNLAPITERQIPLDESLSQLKAQMVEINKKFLKKTYDICSKPEAKQIKEALMDARRAVEKAQELLKHDKI
jgi:hypothetical protein